MSVNAPTIIHDLTRAGMMRIGGTLAVGKVLAQGNTYRERIRLPPSANSIDVRCKATVTGGTPTVQLVPQTADIQNTDLTVSDVASGLTSVTNLSNGTDVTQNYVPKGEMFIDVVIDCTGVSAAATVGYVDVGVRLQ